ncbi:MAG: hypothetical protein E6L09_02175 [Verrucomicrobia bacterium]|nr:MAG: hypothetical protein E6L09_02175 [Verrucomicrobiota bacterium]
MKRDGLLKGIDGPGRVALFVETFAGVHPAGEVIADRDRDFPPQPEGEKDRHEHHGQHYKEIINQTTRGMIWLNGVHEGRVSGTEGTARQTIQIRSTNEE